MGGVALRSGSATSLDSLPSHLKTPPAVRGNASPLPATPQDPATITPSNDQGVGKVPTPDGWGQGDQHMFQDTAGLSLDTLEYQEKPTPAKDIPETPVPSPAPAATGSQPAAPPDTPKVQPMEKKVEPKKQNTPVEATPGGTPSGSAKDGATTSGSPGSAPNTTNNSSSNVDDKGTPDKTVDKPAAAATKAKKSVYQQGMYWKNLAIDLYLFCVDHGF